MNGINSHVFPDCPDYGALHVTAAIKAFQAAKNNRMVGYHHVAAAPDRLFDNFLRGIEAE
jgi:hypothetical protein